MDAGRVHVALLRDGLAVHGQYCAAGMPLSSQAQIALLLRCSELRAGRLLSDALGLVELPEALAALEWGLLTVEQSAVVVAQLAVLSPPDRLRVWQRLLVRLRRDVEQGAVLPPARLTDLLRGWVVEADQDAARERREQAEQDRRVEYRRRDDGLADLFLIGLQAPLAQAVLQRIRDASAPVSLWDERTADQRRLDAAVDLLLGRAGSRCAAGHGPGAACGCLPGTPGLCGTDVAVLVPLPTALGTGNEPAQLVGHGPIDHALLEDLLANTPRLRSPRCEFPGCGARAVRCDAEHDLAWPVGPTCSCNLGPCCRRHHRIKQEGWRKTRSVDGVRWTSVTGRTWLSRHQHHTPEPPTRSLPPLASGPSPWDELHPAELDELLWILDGRPDDPAAWELRAQDREPEDADRTGEHIAHGDTRWTLDLSDPYAWLAPEAAGR